jgi:acetyl esterase/lipase
LLRAPIGNQDGVLRWTVDRRAPSLYARLYVLGMRAARDQRAFEGAERTLRVARRRQRQGDHPPTRYTRFVTRVTRAEAAGLRIWVARPRRHRRVARVVYLHGGGYVHPLTSDYWRLVRALVHGPAEVVVPEYPLAPDATVDDVLPRLIEMVAAIERDDPGVPTVLMGDSAGGALVIAMACEIRDRRGRAGPGRSRPLPTEPAAVVALSPWLDATLREDAVADLESSDPMLAESGLRAAGRWWSGDRAPSDPLVSPVSADLRRLPPLDVFIGAHDILRPAVDDFAARAEEQGADLHVHETPAMFHVWMTRRLPEGRRTRRDLLGLVRQRLSAG